MNGGEKEKLGEFPKPDLEEREEGRGHLGDLTWVMVVAHSGLECGNFSTLSIVYTLWDFGALEGTNICLEGTKK